MEIYLKEKIGNPDLFTGRKKELSFFLKWIDGVKREISPSMAILSRRKTGKTALLQRLYNLTFQKNDGVIPFYFEIEEGKKWAIDFSREFLLTFIYQYIAFKTRKTEYLRLTKQSTFAQAIDSAQREGYDDLAELITNVAAMVQEEHIDLTWTTCAMLLE